MYEKWGVGEGKAFRRFTSEEWKQQALARVPELMPYVRLDGADSAEAALLVHYAARGDEVGQLLPARYLTTFGFPVPPKKAKG
jgi:hypothetical protein